MHKETGDNKGSEKTKGKAYHLDIILDKDTHILILEPKDVLTKNDFQYLATVVDPYIEEGNTLKGLMIKTKNFPGWDSLSAIKEHIAFIKQHHKKIEKLAFVTDSSFIDLIKSITGAFVHPKIKEFKYDAAEEALRWLKT